MPTVIATSTSAATRAFNQRKADRNQDGTLWSFNNTAIATVTPSYSKDNGATWTAATALPGLTNPGLFIDLDDYAHVVWNQSGSAGPNGATLSGNPLYYMRGTPNAGRTAWTWGTPVSIDNSSSATLDNDFPDIVAFRDPANAGAWVAFIAISYMNTAGSNYALIARVNTTSAGVSATAVPGSGLNGFSNADSKHLGGDYSATTHPRPSLDFNHTGDGKTVAGGTPHIYVGWNSGSGGSVGRGVRFRKAVYNAGAWTWNPEREIDTTHSSAGSDAWWHVTHYDGTRVVIAGILLLSGGSGPDIVLYQRDAADTATSTQVLLALANGTTTALYFGSSSYDRDGNVYLFGRDNSGAAGARNVNSRKWTRTTATFGPIVTFDITGPDFPCISAKRGYSSSSIDWVYTDNISSPFNITFERISVNTPPNAPTLSVPSSVDRAQDVMVGVAFSDSNAGDTSSSSAIRFRRTDISPAPAFTVITVNAPVSGVTIPGGTLDAAPYEVQGQSRDSQGATSLWSASSFFTAADKPPAPVFISPVAGETIPVPEQTFTFSQPSLQSFQWRVVGDNAGVPDESVVINAGATVITNTGRSFTVSNLPNSTTIQTQVRVTKDGIASVWTSLRNLVSFTQPSQAVVSLTISSAAATITVTGTQPAPVGGEPSVMSFDVLVRALTTGDRYRPLGQVVRIARMVLVSTSYVDRTVASGCDYEYALVSNATNGTTSQSAWVR